MLNVYFSDISERMADTENQTAGVAAVDVEQLNEGVEKVELQDTQKENVKKKNNKKAGDIYYLLSL